MTVVAYKDGVIAADTLCTAGGLKMGHTKKIAKNAVGDVMGAAGISGWCHAMWQWFIEGEDGPQPVIPQEATGEDTGKAIVIRASDPSRAWMLYSNPRHYPEPISINPRTGIAIGSGRAEAMGAMHAGADAVRAVQAAMDLDDSCGGTDESETLGLAAT